MEQEQILREQILGLLKGGHAHLDHEKILAGVPAGVRGKKPAPDLPTPWQLLEHLRISQYDILEFSRNPAYVSPEWPEGYWPETEGPPEEGAWDNSVAAFGRDLAQMEDLIRDPGGDLFTPFPHGEGQNLLREALVMADHNAYHLGQMVTLRKALGAWPAK